MNWLFKFLPIYLLLEVCRSLRVHLPHDDERYFHHSEQVMQHYNTYQEYDSYSSSSNERVMRQSPRYSKFRGNNRNFDFSNAGYKYKCKCSCTRCNKPRVKPCCEEFCATSCVIHNNILVVPYPVPYVVYNQSSPTPTDYPTTLPPPTTTTSATTTTTKTEPPTTTISTARTSQSTHPFYQNFVRNKRFHVQNLRRGMGNNDIRSPMMGRLPKYGIVPIPENLALSLMQQIKKDQNDDQFRKRLALNKNLLDYTRRPIA